MHQCKKRRIAFIVEGERREQKIFHNIQQIFFQNRAVLDYYRRRIGCLFSLQTDLMRQTEFISTITTDGIYQAQVHQYIEPHGRVFILSAFPQFLLEYFKEEQISAIGTKNAQFC